MLFRSVLPAAFEKVSIYHINNPDASWATRGAAGEPPVVAQAYSFDGDYLRDAGRAKIAAAASSLPRGCDVAIYGRHVDSDEEEDEDLAEPDSTVAAAEVAEALAGRQIKRLVFENFSGMGPRLGRALGAAGAEHLRLFSVGLTDQGSVALAEAVAASVAGGTMRHLGLWQVRYPARLLLDLGAALQRGGPGPSFELEVLGYSEALAAAVHAALATVLGRVSLLSLKIYDGGELLAVGSQALLRLELRFEAEAVQQQLPFRFDAAPALESVLLKYVFPSEAAPLLVALASDPNLPALRAVKLVVAQEGDRKSPHPAPLAPVADGLRRALEQRAGGAAAGAASGEWRVEVEREPSGRGWGVIRVSRIQQ